MCERAIVLEERKSEGNSVAMGLSLAVRYDIVVKRSLTSGTSFNATPTAVVASNVPGATAPANWVGNVVCSQSRRLIHCSGGRE